MLQSKASSGGQGLYFLSGTVVSPTLAAQWKTATAKYPNAKWFQYDPVNRDSARIASRQAFGDFVDPQYKSTSPTSFSRSIRIFSPASGNLGSSSWPRTMLNAARSMPAWP